MAGHRSPKSDGRSDPVDGMIRNVAQELINACFDESSNDRVRMEGFGGGDHGFHNARIAIRGVEGQVRRWPAKLGVGLP